jgi:hypothetical protein
MTLNNVDNYRYGPKGHPESLDYRESQRKQADNRSAYRPLVNVGPAIASGAYADQEGR